MNDAAPEALTGNARWAVASTADLQTLPGGCSYVPPSAAPQAPAAGLFCDKRAAHGLRILVENLTALAAIAVVCLALACLALYRRDPLRSWRGGGPARPFVATGIP
jgi:hypothetical protein